MWKQLKTAMHEAAERTIRQTKHSPEPWISDATLNLSRASTNETRQEVERSSKELKNL